MPQRLAPDAILAQSNLTGAVAALQDDPDSPDSSWLTASGNTVETSVRVSFPSPTGTSLTGTQEFRVLVRKSAVSGTGTPTGVIELYVAGALISTSSTFNVTSTTGQVVAYTWSGTHAPADVECRVRISASGGGPSVRASGDVGAIEWNAEAVTLTAVGKSLDLRWATRAKVAKNLDLRWTTQANSASDLPYQTNIAAHYRADTLALNNLDPVATLPSGFASNLDATQATSTARPVYKTNQVNGKPAIEFDGGDWLRSSGTLALEPATLLAVVKYTVASPSVEATILGSGAGGGGQWRVATDFDVEFMEQGVQRVGTSTDATKRVVTNEWCVLALTYDAAGNYVFRKNGEVAGSGTFDTTIASGALTIGAYGVATAEAEFWVGQIAEIAVFSAVLGSTDLASNENHLLSKYGLSGLTAVGKNLDLRWTTRALATDNLDTRWSVRARISDQIDARWSVRTKVSDDLDTRWTVRARATDNLDLRWRIAAAVFDSLDARWAVRTKTTDNIDLRWGVRTKVFDALDTRWTVRARVTDNLDLRWRVAAAIADTLDLRWRVARAITDSLDARWRVAALAGDQIDVRWRTAAVTGDQIDLRWAIRTAVLDALDLRWAVRAIARDDLDLRWQVLTIGAVGDNLSLLWAVRAAVGDTLDSRWSVRSLAGDNLDARWSVRTPSGDTVDLRWAVRTILTDTLDLRWASRVLAADNADLRWATRTLAGDQLDARWGVRARAGDDVDLRWSVRSTFGEALDVRWAVRTYVFDTLDLRWTVLALAAAGNELTLLWSVRSAAGDAIDVRWDVRSVAGDTISARWAVRTPVGVTFDARWATRTAAGAAIDLRWTIIQLVYALLDLRWEVGGTRAEDARALLWHQNQLAMRQRLVEVVRSLEATTGDGGDLMARTLPRVAEEPPEDDDKDRGPVLSGNPEAARLLWERTRARKRDRT